MSSELSLHEASQGLHLIEREMLEKMDKNSSKVAVLHCVQQLV